MTTLLHDMPRRGKAFADASAHRVAAANANALLLLEQFDAVVSTPDAVDELDRAILQLAVQGKLVAQDPNDEPASELLKRIRDEQDPKGFQKPFGSIRDDEKPFELPEGWEWARWNDISFQIADVDHKMPEEIEEGIPYISPRDFTSDGSISFKTAKKISKKDYEGLADKIKPERGDIIFPRYGTIGVNRFVEVDFEFLASYSCAIVKHMKGFVDARYIFFYSISPFVGEEIKKYINKTTQPNVGIRSIQKFLVPFPPLNEQRRIVARVEQLFAQTRALREKLARSQTELARVNESALAHLLKAETPKEFHAHWSFIAQHFDTLYTEPEHIAPLRQTILELAVRGKLTRREPGDEPASELLKRIREHQDPKGFQKPFGSIRDDEKPFELPLGWEWVRLGEITNMSTGSTPSREHPEYYENGTIPWITSSATNQQFISQASEYITEDAFKETGLRLYPKHTLLVALYGQGKTRGQVSELLIEAAINQACQALTFDGAAPGLREYIKLYLVRNYHEIREQSAGAAQPNLNSTKLKLILLPLPTLAEQRRIVARVEQLMKLCDDLEAKLTAARDERERLTAALLAEIA